MLVYCISEYFSSRIVHYIRLSASVRSFRNAVAEWEGVGQGCLPPYWGKVWEGDYAPSQENVGYFSLQNTAFWCIFAY